MKPTSCAGDGVLSSISSETRAGVASTAPQNSYPMIATIHLEVAHSKLDLENLGNACALKAHIKSQRLMKVLSAGSNVNSRQRTPHTPKNQHAQIRRCLPTNATGERTVWIVTYSASTLNVLKKSASLASRKALKF